jgi:tRNA-splicing ligase RtcB
MPTELAPHLLSWAPDIDDNAREQAIRSSKLPFIHGHVALMPDAHWGMGATVGSVIPTKGAIVPAAVGVDIGCGMIAARLDVDGAPLTSAGLPANLDALHTAISRAVPAGVGQGHQNVRLIEDHADTAAWRKHGADLEKSAGRQLGSLGSGNHFVEICLDESDQVWIVLHSGSRGVGNKLAKVHIDIAQGLMKEWFIELEDRDLAYLVQDTPQFDDYVADMLWAQRYAMENRELMLAAVTGAVCAFLGVEVVLADRINCHHNFTQREHHNGADVWLTRKGAIKAGIGDRGVIPGSMGTRSYIVSGLGNTAAYSSCSHGAGRRLGRKQATRELTYESLEAAMEGKTWNHDRALLDEHPMAYKDIDAVMENQRDLVTVEHTLHQILNYKGS